MKKHFFAACMLTLAALPQSRASLGDEQRLAAANNIFAFKLLKQIAKDQPAANIFISPYSASTILQMVGNGAAGRTKIEMQKVLETSSLSDDVVNQGNKDMAQSLNKGNTNNILIMANGIWYRQDAPVKPEFITGYQHFYDFTVSPFRLDDPHSIDVINDWASEKTHGHITHIADGLKVEDTPRLFLANAVYFKGKWSDPFDPGDTIDHPFYLRDGSQKVIPMMSKSKTFTYRCGTGYQAVRLPYEGENLAMYIFLPDTNSSPEKLLSIMNGDVWQRITKQGFSDEDGDLMLPKFKLEYSVELVQPLQELGMKTAFDATADFSGICPKHFISDVGQTTFVEINEEGTEAAAITTMQLPDSVVMPPPKRFEMIVNRPFLFLIEDNQTGSILFMGVIYDPPAD
jgi:serine protease inhibitor